MNFDLTKFNKKVLKDLELENISFKVKRKNTLEIDVNHENIDNVFFWLIFNLKERI